MPTTQTTLDSAPNSQLNADPQELQHFNQLAEQWWDLDGEFAALHKINPLRCDFIAQSSTAASGRDLSELRLLDIGCGGGILSEAMAARGASVTGIDLAEASLAAAREHAEQSGLKIDYQCIAAEQAAAEIDTEQRQRYDIVTCMEMLEHVPDPASIVRAAATLCKPGGSLFFATINRTAKAYALMIIGAEYLLKMVPVGTHDYSKFIKPSELARWLRAAEIETTASSGIVYNPLSKQFRLHPHDLDVNYMLHCQKPA